MTIAHSEAVSREWMPPLRMPNCLGRTVEDAQSRPSSFFLLPCSFVLPLSYACIFNIASGAGWRECMQAYRYE